MQTIFLLLFMLALLFTAIFTLKPPIDKKTGKRFKRGEVAVVFGIITAIFAILVGVTAPHAKTTTKSTPSPVVKAVIPTPQPKPVAKTLTAAELKTQSIKLLTDATTVYENLYAKVQADSAKTDAANASSDFYKDKHYFDTNADVSGYNAYLTATDAYTNAKLVAPASIESWETDSSQLYTDINQWTQAKYSVLWICRQITQAPMMKPR